MFVNKCYVRVLMFRCGTVAVTIRGNRTKEEAIKIPEREPQCGVRLLLQSKVKVLCLEISSLRALVSLHCSSSLS
jgi:hypothetical protein